MRLIDADALMEIAKQDGAYDYVSAEEIADAPTIDICKDCDCRRTAIEALSDRPKVNVELKVDWLRQQYEIVIEENKRLKADR